MRQKVLSILALLLVAATGAWAATLTVTWNNSDISSSSESFTKDGVTMNVTGMNCDFDDKNFTGGTFTSTVGNFTKIEVTADDFGNMGSGWSVVSLGPNQPKKATWTGTASSTVSFGGDGFMDGIWGMGGGVTIVFTIEEPNVSVTSITLAPATASMTVGETLMLTATVLPDNATDKTVTWTSSDPSVATVANGVVTAVAAGTATITATVTNGTDDTSDDKTATCTVTVVNPTTTLAENTDNASWLTVNNGKVFDVTLNRTLQAGGWNTFAVPFSTAIPSGWTVKQLASSELTGDLLSLNFTDATSIEAGTPYLVKVEADVENPTFEGVTVSYSTPNVVITSNASFVPAVNKMYVVANENILFLKDGHTLTYPTETAYIPGFRAVFMVMNESVNARSFQMNFGDETTGIKTIGNASLTENSSAVYDLQGRRVATPTRGLYIVNGKKVAIK